METAALVFGKHFPRLMKQLLGKDYGGPQKTNNVLSSKSTQLKGVDNEQEKETVQFRIQS